MSQERPVDIKSSTSTWVGVDPGGRGHFGVAILRDGVGQCRCFDCAAEAADYVLSATDGKIAGVGVDAPMWWSCGPSGSRRADEWIRAECMQRIGGTVQTINSLRGAVLVQGMMFVERLRSHIHDVRVTETHPKALLKYLQVDSAAFFNRHGVRGETTSQHECDALISAVAAREGFEGRWTRDLSNDRHEREQDPKGFWLAPVHYFWPE